MNGTAVAYSRTGSAWQEGPGRVYDELARVAVGFSPVPMTGRLLLDLGAGTGAGSRAIVASGGRAVALDPAPGMLAHDRSRRPPAVAGDARAIPLADGAVGGVLAACSLNHLTDPAAGLREAARVTGPGGPLIASTFAVDDGHPVKAVVESVLAEHGWVPEDWYTTHQAEAIPRLATPEACAEVAAAAGLDAEVQAAPVPFPDLGAADLVQARLGMAHHAPFVATLPAGERAAVKAEAMVRLGQDWPVLVRSLLVITAVVE